MSEPRDDGCTCKRIEWDESYHEIHRPGCPATLAPEDRPVADEPMVERLDSLRLFESVYAAMFEYGKRIGRLAAEDEYRSQLREQRDRTSYWETLHDERVESLEAERDTYRQRAEEADELADAITEANVRLARELLAAERTVREQRGHIVGALRELGIPGPDYLAPVANAVAILTATLASLTTATTERSDEA